jgi:hypothetical protein
LTNGEVVIEAFDRCGIAMAKLEQPHFYSARRKLNLMLSSEWSNIPVNLWKVSLNSQLLTQGTATYTLPANVVMVLDAYRSTQQGTVSQTDIFMTPISRDDYAAYPMKQTQAPPTQFWLDRQITPQVTLYPVPDNGGPYFLNYYAWIRMQDANLPGGETPDVINRWVDALCAGLAYRLSPTYAPDRKADLKIEYKEALDLAKAQDIENVNIRIIPKMGGYWS